MYVYSFKMDWAEAPPTLYPKSEFSMSKEEDGVKISGNVNVFDESYNYEILLTNVSDEDYIRFLEFLGEVQKAIIKAPDEKEFSGVKND